MFTQRMEILIHHPPLSQFRPSINWSHDVVGTFFDHSPPNTSFVSNIINNHWDVREPIRVHRTGPYFVFECYNLLDRDALISLNTTCIDGKIITFRPSLEDQILATVNFNMARLWVRIQDLPWGFLDSEWTVRILSHVGLVEAINNAHSGLPPNLF